MSIDPWNVWCLLLFMENQIAHCNLFVHFPHSIFCLVVAYSLSLFGVFSPFTFLPPPHPFFYRLKNLDQFILISFPVSPEIFSSLRLHPFPCLSPSTAISLVEGQWLEWGPWSRCSVTCNTGTQERQRRCSSSVHGWAECKGLHQESRECTNPSCSGKARKWMLCIQTHMLSNAIMQTWKMHYLKPSV